MRAALANNNMTDVQLPSVLLVGFTGHRDLPNAPAARAAIVKILSAEKAEARGIVCGVSSVAAGGDLLFAEVCIDLGLPLHVLLPMPKEEFRADFAPADWQRVERVLERALSVNVTGRESSRDARYYECGIETVRRSQALIALWNGEPSQGLGGTQQIVDFATAAGLPIYWVHSTTAEVQLRNQDGRTRGDPELEFLNGLPQRPRRSAESGPVRLPGDWFAKIDAYATRTGPRVRRIAVVPIVCTAAASLFSTIGVVAGGDLWWLGLGTGFGLAAALLPAAMRLRRQQRLWARVRTAAEIARSNLALWRAPGAYDLVGPEAVPELAGMLASLNFLKVSSGASVVAGIEEFKRDYRQNRVQEQIRYFSEFAAVARRRARWFTAVTVACVVLATLANAWGMVDRVWLDGGTPQEWQPAITLGGAVLFQLATIVGALLAINDYSRRRQRYTEMEHSLKRWDAELEQAHSWPVLLQIAGRIERALLVEVIEWRSLIRHRKLTQR